MDVTRNLTLPLSLDEVTPQWLTVALGERFPGIRVAGAVRDAERAGTSTSARFLLDLVDPTDDQPSAVYVKGGFDPVMRRRVWAALIQEARFYAELADDVPVDVPVAYFCGVDEEARQGVVILEDMTARGVHFGHATDKTSVETVHAVVEGLGRLHAAFWGDPRLAEYGAWREPQRAYLRYLYRDQHWESVMGRPYADQLAAIIPDPAAGLRALERMWELDDARTPTLLHGDCHGGNLFHDGDRPGFLDWQCTFPGAAGHDLQEMIVTSLPADARASAERDLVEHYRETLVASGVADAPSVDELFLSYRQNLMHGMASAVLNPYDMQTEEVTVITAVRTLEAAAQLDMLDALGLA